METEVDTKPPWKGNSIESWLRYKGYSEEKIKKTLSKLEKQLAALEAKEAAEDEEDEDDEE